MLLKRIFGERCRLCGTRGVSSLGAVPLTQHDVPFETSEYSLRHCRQCDVVYLDPLPSAGDLKLMYEELDQFTDAHYTAPERVAGMLDFYDTALRDYKLLPAAGAKALEIGAGYAWVSRACKERDARVFTVAQDVSAECANKCPWVDSYFVGPLAGLTDRGPFALISLTHVIEHLADPAAILLQIADLLIPGGKVFVTAPYRPSGWSANDGIAPWLGYSYLHVPAHITYFSKRWFQKYARAFKVDHWDATPEDGQAFTLILRKR